MKHLPLISALLVILFSCKKEITQSHNNDSLLSKIELQLKDSISASDFQQLDFNHSIFSKFEKNNFSILRIPFYDKSIQTDFILLKIENSLAFSTGRIINITSNPVLSRSIDSLEFNGKLIIYSLKRNLLTESLITNGYVEAFHLIKKNNNGLLKQEVAEVPLMPEVIVRSSYGPNAWSHTDWYNIISFIDNGGPGGGGNGAYYNYSGAQGSGGGGGGTAPAIPNNTDPIYIDFEPVEDLPAIDVLNYIKCFNNIPDDGATCSITILTDIPVDKDPTAFFSWELGSPGHTFLQLRKSNGNQIIQQHIGFYPAKNWKTIIVNTPIEGKLVDNAGHEFNAALSMDMTPSNFQAALNYMQVLAGKIMYDIDDYNCTNFALDVFNHNRVGNKLFIPMYNIPRGNTNKGTATPQGLYRKLKAMKDQSDPESESIIIPGVKGFAGISKGPCN